MTVFHEKLARWIVFPTCVCDFCNRTTAGADAADSEQSEAAAAVFHRNVETDGRGARRRQGCAREHESRAEAVRSDGETDSNRADDAEHTPGSAESVDWYL